MAELLGAIDRTRARTRAAAGIAVGRNLEIGDPRLQRIRGESGALLLRPNLAAFALYLLVSILFFGLRVIGNPATAHVGERSDPSFMIWCMAWWPHAIAHRLNPFFTHSVWAPTGYNLTWSTSIPAVAIALAPFTFAFGPVVSYNIAALLAPALSAWAAFMLCHRATRSFRGSIAGGLVYGFSPYEVGHVLSGHLSLTPNFVPPLCVLLVLMLLHGEIARRAFVAALASLLIVQCLISNEILATMLLFGGLAFLLGAALMPAQRRAMLGAIAPIAFAGFLATIILSPFLYYALAKGSVPSEPLFPSSFFSTDLLSFVLPTPLMAICPRAIAAIWSHFSGNIWENGSYLSLPLLAAAGHYFWRRRTEPVARLLALFLVFNSLAALGPVLHVDGRPIMALPWKTADALPLIKYALPVRFSNYAFLATALIVSLWLSETKVRFKNALACYALAALVPNPILLLSQGHYDRPAFFAQGLYRKYLSRDANVLVIPYGVSGESMAWQGEAWMYFRMAGGWLGPTPEEFRRWPIVNTLLTALPVAQPAEQFRAFVAAHRINMVIVTDGAKGAARELPASLGVRPIRVGGVSLYPLHNDNVVTGAGAGQDPRLLERTAVEQWFSELLQAANRFLLEGQSLATLSPAKAYDLGLLPESKWSSSLDLTLAGTSHAAVNGLWIGPGDGGTIEVGLFASRTAIEPLVGCYGPGATRILYPYPHKYAVAAASDESVHFMVMMLRPDFVRRAPYLAKCG